MDDDIEEGTAPAEDEDAAPAVAPERLAGGKLELVAPTSLAERWDLYLASLRVPRVSALRIWCAAIGLCWPRMRKALAANGVTYSGDVVEFGGQVQGLLQTGAKPAKAPCSFAELSAAGRAALAVATADLATNEAVKAKAGFSAAPGERSPESSS